MNKHFSRRKFLQVSSATAIAGAATFSSRPMMAAANAPAVARGPFRGTLCLFSKPVPQLSWQELARSAKQAGFGGIDLTVRPEGHVLPERVAVDLPKAVAAIRAEGLEVPMISTALTSVDDPAAGPTLESAGQLSIPFVKPGYYYYKLANVFDEVREAGIQFRGLAELAGKNKVQLGFHNHARCIGAPIWDMASFIEPLDPSWSGFYFDLGHCTTDGGESGWEIATNLVIPRLKMVAVKDFYWKKKPGTNRLEAAVCPLGQGMVPWSEFLHILAKSDFHGPISLHHEFSLPDVSDNSGIAVSRATIPAVMSSLKTNLDHLKSLLHEAYEGA